MGMSLAPPSTELSLPDLVGFDTWSDAKILTALLAGQRRALDAVERAFPVLAQAAVIIADKIAGGGRLIYAGAGTSIRVAVQDGSELPATFGMREEQLDYFIAGGRDAMFDTLADAEDDMEAGAAAAELCTSKDVLVAVAASGRTPYTCGAARRAQEKGAAVIAVVNNANSPLAEVAAVEVLLETGPEVISGSTRLGAGTAQKAALNLISTLAHTRLGAIHDGLMVNVQAGNAKLAARARNIVVALTGVSESAATQALSNSGGHIKPAVLLCKGAENLVAAQRILAGSKENLRLALSRLNEAG